VLAELSDARGYRERFDISVHGQCSATVAHGPRVQIVRESRDSS
jgi:hypothetical protein